MAVGFIPVPFKVGDQVLIVDPRIQGEVVRLQGNLYVVSYSSFITMKKEELACPADTLCLRTQLCTTQ